MNIALIAPNKQAYSETFILAHKEKLKGNIFYYHDGFFPAQLEGYGSIFKKEGVFLSIYYYSMAILIKLGLVKKDWNLFFLARSFKKNKIDVVLAEYGQTAAEVLATCKYANVPLVVHFHGFDASHYDTLEKYKKGYCEVSDYASALIAVSHKMKQTLVQLGLAERKILINTYGPNDIFFENKFDPTSKTFLAVGRFTDKKAPYLTLAAFKLVNEKNKHARLIMCGTGNLWNTCKNLSVLWGLKEYVDFRGVTTPDEINKLFCQSLGFVQHSIVADDGDSEGTPVAILEASAAGLPIVSTFHAGIPDVIIDKVTGLLVEEKEVEKMANAMLFLLDNPDVAQKMGEKGRENIATNFSMDKHIGKLQQILEDAIKK